MGVAATAKATTSDCRRARGAGGGVSGLVFGAGLIGANLAGARVASMVSPSFL